MIVAAFVPMSGTNLHFASAEDGTKEYGITNENSQVKTLIKQATMLQSTYESAYDKTTKERLQNQIDAIERQLEELGIPTWEKYQSNPKYWIRVPVEKMEEQYGVSEYYRHYA